MIVWVCSAQDLQYISTDHTFRSAPPPSLDYNNNHLHRLKQWCQGLSLSKRNQLAALWVQKGASRRLSRTKIAFTCIPWGDVQNTGLSRPATHTHACTHTHTLICRNTRTFSLSFMPDYNRIILTYSMPSQTYGITWERWMVQKITVIRAYI